jgi:hypothetical protein
VAAHCWVSRTPEEDEEVFFTHLSAFANEEHRGMRCLQH